MDKEGGVRPQGGFKQQVCGLNSSFAAGAVRPFRGSADDGWSRVLA